MTKKTIFFIGLLALFFSTVSLAGESVGTLILEKGMIKLRRISTDNFYQEAGTQIQVQELDEIQTGPNTSVIINLTKKEDKIIISSNSFLTLKDVTPEESTIEMPIGKAQFKIKKRRIAKGRNRFRLRTANAIIGVKGTEFVAGAYNGNTSLLTLEGSVTIASLETPEVEVEVKLNQASQIKKGAQPTAPVVVPPKIRESIITSDDPKAFNAVTFGVEIKVTKSQNGAKKTADKDDSKEGEDNENAENVESEVDIDEIISEVLETVDEVVDDTPTSPTELKVTIEVTE